jgi:hypothetical protein
MTDKARAHGGEHRDTKAEEERGQESKTTMTRCILLLAVACCLLLPSAASGIQAALGETIPLEGYSSGSMYVYLFLTGPNLPVNGVQLNDVTKRADEGYFTRVTVDGNDHWSYKWNTANPGGRLDAGTYTIWVVNGPNDLSRLAQADYRTLSVTLGKPTLSVDTPPQRGSLGITSDPSGAIVSIGSREEGRTPLSISDLSPGMYTLTFHHEGYHEFSTPVRVEAGRISEVSATLVPVTPEPVPIPTGTEQGQPASSPAAPLPQTTRAPGLLPALAGALFLAAAFRHR